MNSILLVVPMLMQPPADNYSHWRILWDYATIEIKLLVIRALPNTAVAESSARSIRNTVLRSGDSLPPRRKRIIAGMISSILECPFNSDAEKVALCFAISRFGNDARPAAKGMRAYAVSIQNRPVPKGLTRIKAAEATTKRLEEFLETLIQRTEK